MWRKTTLAAFLMITVTACGGVGTTESGNPSGEVLEPSAASPPAVPSVTGTRTFSQGVGEFLCDRMSSCNERGSFDRDSCIAEVMGASGFAERFYLDPELYPSLQAISEAEEAGALVLNPSFAQNCLEEIRVVSCELSADTAAELLPASHASCPDVFTQD